MEQSIFIQLSLVIVVAMIVSLVMRLLKQPLIMGYILTGIIVGPTFLNLIQSGEAFESFGDIGIALLLFIIGLGLNAAVIRSLGKVVLLASLIEVSAIGLLGYFAGTALGFSTFESVLIGLSLIFSSTIIILKVLSDKKEQGRLYGQIAIGVILVEDLIAIFALLLVAGFARSNGLSLQEFVPLIVSGLLIGLSLVVASLFVLPRLTRFFASSQEFLFLFAIAYGLGMATLFEYAGLTLEIGALFAGVSLASLPYAQEMAARLKPLRDFFIVLFFVVLGGSFNLGNLWDSLVPALILSAIAIFGKPLFIMAALGVLGYTKRTSFKTAIHLSQISEFSIVLVVFAQSVGVGSDSLSAVITLVALITIAASTYLMQYDDALYAKMENRLRLFESRLVTEEKKPLQHYPLVLFGYKKGGHEFVRTFREMKKKYVVVDYNPEVIETLEHQHVHFMYGDATDNELLDEIGIVHAELVVSTISDFSTNQEWVRIVRKHNQKTVIIVHADSYNEAAELYQLGATYVMLPHFIGSERISAFLRKRGTSKEAFEQYRQKHLVSLGRTAMRRR